MKAIFNIVLIATLFFTFSASSQHLEKVWETSSDLKTPESVLYDDKHDIIYVANINGVPNEKDGNGFISILDENGKAVKLKWATGLNAPKGMAIWEDKLFVSDIDELVEIQIPSGVIVNKYKADHAVFLNDVAVYNGMVFVSDTRTARIHVLEKGKFSIWLEGSPFETPNGLFAKNGQLYVGDKNIYKVDIATGKTDVYIKDAGGVDGLEENENGDFVFSNWPGRIYINKDGKNIKLHDSTKEKLNTADLDFDFEHQLILVPTFYDNRIVAFRIVF